MTASVASTQLAMACVAAILAAPAPTQDAASFDRAYSEYAAAPLAERAQRAAAASDCFLRLPNGAERRQRLGLGAAATLDAGRTKLALELAEQALDAGVDASSLVTSELRALARLGRVRELVTRARRRARRHGDAVQQAFRLEERELLPLAATALRQGDRESGRYVFEQLAALQPPESYRLANLALCLRQLGDAEAALQVYERARHLAPDDIELENDFGLLLRATGQPEAALEAFWRSQQRDLLRPEPLRGRGPAITNLLHFEALRPGAVDPDPVPPASAALARRPDAAMLRRLLLDVHLDRLDRGRAKPSDGGRSGVRRLR